MFSLRLHASYFISSRSVKIFKSNLITNSSSNSVSQSGRRSISSVLSNSKCQLSQRETHINEVKMTPAIRSITAEKLSQLKKKFLNDNHNLLAQNSCATQDPLNVCLSRRGLDDINHVFNTRIETEGKPITNQKSSGRCWLFAFLNCVRVPFMKHYNIDEFEFSQAYLFFCDKIEKCHFFLNNIILTYKRGEQVDGRLVSYLLQDPCSDGGQWDMIRSLVTIYGLMPKKNFQESFSSESSSRLNNILRSKLREYTKELRDLMDLNKSQEEIQSKVDEQLEQIFRIVSICLGVPKDQFVWEYYDKAKNYHSVGPISPRDFYEEYVKPVFNVEDKVCLVNDPRPTSPYGKAYTVDCLGNMVGGNRIIYNNQPIELLESVAVSSIKRGDAVWFGCEVAKRFAAKHGIEDLTIHDYSLVFGTEVTLGLSKADRLIYGESCMTHAMVFTACSVDEKTGKVSKWRVENSWGDERGGDKGYIMLTSEWFKEFVFEVVVDKSLLEPEVLAVFDTEPILLPAYDPMGTLAKACQAQNN